MVKKADYSRIATHYDEGRKLLQQNLDIWLELLAQYIDPDIEGRLLDLGCGTGRFTIPIARRFSLQVVGADSSPDMLVKAQAKSGSKMVKWEQQDADALDYEDATFDFVFMSHLLHHVDSPIGMIRDCLRILKPAGTLLIRYGAIEQIRDDVEHRFFPGILEIDEARTPSRVDVEAWLAEAGFTGIESRELMQRTYASGQDRLAAAAVKSTSVLSLIPAESLRQGLDRLEQHLQASPDDPWLLQDRLSLTTGCKTDQ